jgi:carbon monoxide dehydrogenase subunit G
VELTHEFTVPATVDQTWEALNDIESVAGCFPGATVTSAEGDTFQGSCKVKLGPIALVYNGTGSFVEKDEASHTMRIEAKGKDKRGNGAAGADVVATLTDSGPETQVKVVTDLAITGKPAQFGRGVMQDVSNKLLDQFVDCLKGKVGDVHEAANAADAASAAATAEPGQAQDSPPAVTPAPSMAPPEPVEASRPPPEDDVLDLGATVLPVLLKSYGKQLAAGAGVLLVLLLILRRLLR